MLSCTADRISIKLEISNDNELPDLNVITEKHNLLQLLVSLHDTFKT